MAEGNQGEAYLLIDVGHVLTHAAYISRVEGAARLAAVAEASTTTTAVEGGLLDGVRRATANLELLVGRQILDRAGELRQPRDADGHGVDGVVVTASLAPLLNVALVGLTRDFSLASAVRAATLPYVSLQRAISLDGSGDCWDAEDLEALVQQPPDVVVIVGGADGGPVTPIREMGEALSTAYSLLAAPERPAIVFAGNERACRPLQAAFTGVVEVSAVANVRPSPQKEDLGGLQNELARLFYNRLGRCEGLRQLSHWAQVGLRHDLDALARTLRFVARRHGLARGVLGVDAGGNGSRVLWVRSEGPALNWASPFGLGSGLAALRQLNDPTAVVRWMYHPISWAEVWDRLSNIEVRPGGVPETEEDWDLQQAAVREALAATWKGALGAWAAFAEGRPAGEADMIVARGTTFNHARTPGQAALMLLDALQPTGLVRLALDWANLLPGLSGLAERDPQAAVQVYDHDALLELGTVVAPRGVLRSGARALHARLTVAGQARAELDVPAGSIRRLPLGVNERGRLELYPARGLDVGLGRRGRGGVVEVRGGALGIIIDARGRPLRMPDDDEARRSTLEAWQREIEEP